MVRHRTTNHPENHLPPALEILPLFLLLLFITSGASVIQGSLHKKIIVEEEEMEENKTYAGKDLWAPVSGRPVFGGQLLAQSLYAASITEDFLPHMMQCSFCKPVEPQGESVQYKVSHHLSKGGSFYEVEVEGRQNTELCVKSLVSFVTQIRPDLVSFDKAEEKDEDFEGMLSMEEYFRKRHGGEEDVALRLKGHAELSEKFEVRFLDVGEGKRRVAVRVREGSFPTTETREKYCAIAFISDLFLLETAILLKGEDIFSARLNILSTEHQLHFRDLRSVDIHRPIFYEMEIEYIENNLALCSGTIFQDGTTIAHVTQKGAIREKKTKRTWPL